MRDNLKRHLLQTVAWAEFLKNKPTGMDEGVFRFELCEVQGVRYYVEVTYTEGLYFKVETQGKVIHDFYRW